MPFDIKLKNFSMAGTLGDAFLVYCKLYDYHKKTSRKIGLYRYSRHINFDNPIADFLKNIDFIKYLAPCNYTDHGITKDDKLKAPLINTSWHGRGYSGQSSDPREIKFNPFPDVFVKPKRVNSKFTIGIQYKCGRAGKDGNSRGVSLKWIKDLRKALPKSQIALFGIVSEDERIDKFCKENKIINFVNRTNFKEWLARIKGLDFFITFEGFPAYFAMSQKIYSLVFFIIPTILQRIHPQWKKNNTIYCIKHPLKYRLLRKTPHYSPNTYPVNINLAKKVIQKIYAKKNR
ncbi:hypothetical protein CL633_01650 [bacterium]|nr:hypothetical protein [bacterium]|tara:strand:+ start:1159 stop:2025 length:867 start_codon:yes stop_codon:yes gene_type:complete